MHGSSPVVQVSIRPNSARTVVWKITVGVSQTHYAGTQCDVVAVCVMGGSQVFLHPALVADLHSVIDIAVVVGDGGTVQTRLRIVTGDAIDDGDGNRGVACATMTVGTRNRVGGGAGRVDGDAAARSARAPAVAAGAGGGEHGAGTAASAAVA